MSSQQPAPPQPAPFNAFKPNTWGQLTLLANLKYKLTGSKPSQTKGHSIGKENVGLPSSNTSAAKAQSFYGGPAAVYRMPVGKLHSAPLAATHYLATANRAAAPGPPVQGLRPPLQPLQQHRQAPVNFQPPLQAAASVPAPPPSQRPQTPNSPSLRSRRPLGSLTNNTPPTNSNTASNNSNPFAQPLRSQSPAPVSSVTPASIIPVLKPPTPAQSIHSNPFATMNTSPASSIATTNPFAAAPQPFQASTASSASDRENNPLGRSRSALSASTPGAVPWATRTSSQQHLITPNTSVTSIPRPAAPAAPSASILATVQLPAPTPAAAIATPPPTTAAATPAPAAAAAAATSPSVPALQQALQQAIAAAVAKHPEAFNVPDKFDTMFDNMMHPGRPDKLDGPLPHELPDDLRHSKDWYSHCRDWNAKNQPTTGYKVEQPPAAALRSPGMSEACVRALNIAQHGLTIGRSAPAAPQLEEATTMQLLDESSLAAAAPPAVVPSVATASLDALRTPAVKRYAPSAVHTPTATPAMAAGGGGGAGDGGGDGDGATPRAAAGGDATPTTTAANTPRSVALTPGPTGGSLCNLASPGTPLVGIAALDDGSPFSPGLCMSGKQLSALDDLLSSARNCSVAMDTAIFKAAESQAQQQHRISATQLADAPAPAVEPSAQQAAPAMEHPELQQQQYALPAQETVPVAEPCPSSPTRISAVATAFAPDALTFQPDSTSAAPRQGVPSPAFSLMPRGPHELPTPAVFAGSSAPQAPTAGGLAAAVTAIAAGKAQSAPDIDPAGPSTSTAGPAAQTGLTAQVKEIEAGIQQLSALKQGLLAEDNVVDVASITRLLQLKLAVDKMLHKTSTVATAAPPAAEAQPVEHQPEAGPGSRSGTPAKLRRSSSFGQLITRFFSPKSKKTCPPSPGPVPAAATAAAPLQQVQRPSSPSLFRRRSSSTVVAGVIGPVVVNTPQEVQAARPARPSSAGALFRRSGGGAEGDTASRRVALHHKAAAALAAAAAEPSAASGVAAVAPRPAHSVVALPARQDLWRRYEDKIAEHRRQMDTTKAQLDEALQKLGDMQTEFDELLLCLGMESAKNQALCDAMRAAGLDPEPILRAVEEQWMEENMSG